MVSPDQPELICGLAHAVADGALEAAGESARVTRTRHDPERRTCVLEIGHPA